MKKQPKILQLKDFSKLLTVLKQQQYQTIAPTICDGAIVYDEIDSIAELPQGWTQEQEAGVYSLKKRKDKAFFGYNVGPTSWKKFLYPPKSVLWKAKRKGKKWIPIAENTAPKFAFLGIRSCELAAIAIQDKIFCQGDYIDPIYKSRRDSLLKIAVNCTQADNTCFCVSMKTGPEVTSDYDLLLTEVIEEKNHFFIVAADSEKGKNLLDLLPTVSATDKEQQKVKQITAKTASQMGRQMDTTDIKELLYRNHRNSTWKEVANRCLTCANCTMVCPTCFCSDVEDVTDLTGEEAQRVRRWDSCFTMDFSYIHGGNVRHTAKARYRQWLTHKLGTWIDQFGSSGCVGCGRCITWCPVGIDITEEIQKIRDSDKGKKDEGNR